MVGLMKLSVEATKRKAREIDKMAVGGFTSRFAARRRSS